MVLDTGSSNFVVGSKVWKELCLPRLYGELSLTAYDSYSLSVLTASSVSVTLRGVEEPHDFVVVSIHATAILSRVWLAAVSKLQTWNWNANGVTSVVKQDFVKPVFVWNLY